MNDYTQPVFMFSIQIDAILTAFANRIAFIAIFILLLCTACGEESAEIPDVEHLKKPLLVRHFEQDLFQLDTTQIAREAARLDATYPGFTDIFFRYVIPLRRGDFAPQEQEDILKAYLNYPLSQELYRLSQEQFANWPARATSRLQSSHTDLTTAMAFFRYYLPEATVPDTVVTFVSQFEFAGFLYGDNKLAIGLDMFLGPDFDYKTVSTTDPIFSSYLTRTYTPPHLATKMMQLLIEDQTEDPAGGRLIDYLINNGKKLYLLDKVLPNTPDSIKLEMTATQVEWLAENEAQVYIFLQSEELLYETDTRKFRKYIDPSPNSPGMPAAAPGRSANYLGWKIVAAWMQQHPEASINELLSISDGQRILEESRYKPSRF